MKIAAFCLAALMSAAFSVRQEQSSDQAAPVFGGMRLLPGYACTPPSAIEGRWTISKVSDDGDAEASTSLALAAGGHPRVAYRRRGGGLVLASFDGRAWSIAEVAGGNVGASSSLALDIAGLPRIAYTDADLRALQLAVATESAPPSKP